MQEVPKLLAAKAISSGSGVNDLVVVAIGEVPTSGWTNPVLTAVIYVVPPKDGIQDFTFFVDPPAGRVIQMPMPIAAEASAKADVANYWGKGLPLKGVRIHSESNDIEAPIEVASSVSLLAEGLSLPWPFPWRSNQASDSVALQGGDLPFPYFLGKIPQLPWPISSALIGKTLRVYHTGDPLTDDYRPDRANIELSPATQRIVAVWFG
jgi:hypothetical protein